MKLSPSARAPQPPGPAPAVALRRGCRPGRPAVRNRWGGPGRARGRRPRSRSRRRGRSRGSREGPATRRCRAAVGPARGGSRRAPDRPAPRPASRGTPRRRKARANRAAPTPGSAARRRRWRSHRRARGRLPGRPPRSETQKPTAPSGPVIAFVTRRPQSSRRAQAVESGPHHLDRRQPALDLPASRPARADLEVRAPPLEHRHERGPGRLERRELGASREIDARPVGHRQHRAVRRRLHRPERAAVREPERSAIALLERRQDDRHRGRSDHLEGSFRSPVGEHRRAKPVDAHAIG